MYVHVDFALDCTVYANFLCMVHTDPHVRVVGGAEAVRTAGILVRQELEPQNKVTMKLDVPWTYHSHIIGKGGQTIQPVVKRTG